MKFFTKQWYEKMQQTGIFPIHESEEEWKRYIQDMEEEGIDWKAELRENLNDVKDELLEMLPERFHPYVLDGTLNLPGLQAEIRDDYLHWIHEKEREVESVMDQYVEYLDQIREQMPEGLLEILEAGLHDARIADVFRTGNQLRILLDGGYGEGHRIVIEIKGILDEISDFHLEPGMYWLYEEGHLCDGACKLGVLFDEPISEWEVTAEEFQISQYYKKDSGIGWEEDENKIGAQEESIELAENELNIPLPKPLTDLMLEQNGGKIDHPYFVTKDLTLKIIRFMEIGEMRTKDGIMPFAIAEDGKISFSAETGKIQYFTGNGKMVTLANSFSKFLDKLYTDKNPEKDLFEFEPLAEEEIEEALYSDNLELVVQALNTVALAPEKHVSLIEKTLIHLLDHKDESINETAELFTTYLLEVVSFSNEFLEILRDRDLV